MRGNRCWQEVFRGLHSDRTGPSEAGRGGSAIRHKRSGFRSNASMVIRKSLHRGGHGEHGLLLETGVQHTGRRSSGDPGQSRTGESASREKDRPSRLPMVGRAVAAWISSSELYSSTRYSRIAGSDTTAAKAFGKRD